VERGKLKVGSMRGGHMGTRQHPDAPEERHTSRRRILNAQEEMIDMEDPAEPTETGIVAPGRTVEAPVIGKKKFVGFDKQTGVRVYGPLLNRFGPNQSVTLPVSEITRLRELGFLLDPNKQRRTAKDAAMSQANIANDPRTAVTYQPSPGASISRA
jgi:hypothetical protein